MGLMVELDYEAVDDIVYAQLRETWENFKNDLGKERHIFVWGDPEADDAEIQRHIDALEVLLKWYATPEQLKEIGLSAE